MRGTAMADAGSGTTWRGVETQQWQWPEAEGTVVLWIMKVGSHMMKRWRCDRGTTEAEGGAKVAEDGGRHSYESCHGVVVAAGRAEKMQLLWTTSATTVTRFSTRARRATAFWHVQWWSDVVVAAAEFGGYRVGWCGRERRRRLRLGYWLCEGEKVMRWHVLIGDLSLWRIDDVAICEWLF